MRLPLVAYVLSVLACNLALTGWGLARTPLRTADLSLFAALLGCSAVCIEATRRFGVPAGVSRDLLSAWWLPVALLLPPLYALAAPVLISAMLQLRVRRSILYRRVFSSAALGLAGAAASVTFRWLSPGVGVTVTVGSPSAWVLPAGPRAWFMHPAAVAIAVGCAALFTVVNAGLVAIAAHAAEPETRWREVMWDLESLLLDITELCVGVLVATACALSPLLLFVALPPVILMQRSLLHQQLRAAARTDAKTGLLNASAWQREADAEITRALRADSPLALLLVDIDHFKRVNDTHGHLVGDHVLLRLAGELGHEVRDADVLGRFGGEEFVVLLPGADAEEACRVAERLRARAAAITVPADGTPIAEGQPGYGFQRPRPSEGIGGSRGAASGNEPGGGPQGFVPLGDAASRPARAGVSVTISIGIAMLRTHGRDPFELLAAADLALYRAKDSGRDQVRMFAPREREPGKDSAGEGGQAGPAAP